MDLAQPSKRQWLIRKILLGIVLFVIGCLGLVNLLPDLILKVPPDSWHLSKSDVIIVLGTPAKADGKPTPVMRERVDESVKLWKEGYARYIIFSGAAAHNKYVEAEVMGDLARSRGVSPECVILEPHAQNTYQNAFDSFEIAKEHGWKSAIVVSSKAHLRRANYIFSHYPITYCVDGCNDPPELSDWNKFSFDQREKFHLLAAILSGQSSSFGLSPDQAVQMQHLSVAEPKTGRR